MISNPTNHKQISDLREEVASLESQLATSQAETAYWRKAYEEKTFDFSGATIQASEILSGEKGYDSTGSLITGTMTNHGTYTATTSYGGPVTIPAGYHNGSGKITGGSFDFSGANVTAADLAFGVLAWNANGELIGQYNPLNTDQLTLGMNTVYFTAYPSIKWHVDHIDGNYVYLGLYNVTERTQFGSDNTYSGSTIAAKCTTFLNDTIPNVAQYLEDVTVEGVTNKVFIPTYYQMSGNTGYGDSSGPVFTYLSGSATNRVNMLNNNWSDIGKAVWLSSPGSSSGVRCAFYDGRFGVNHQIGSYGFRPEVKVRYKA